MNDLETHHIFINFTRVIREILPLLPLRSHGGTDMKLTSSAMATNLEFVSISGPAYGFDLPPFQWSKVSSSSLPRVILIKYWFVYTGCPTCARTYLGQVNFALGVHPFLPVAHRLLSKFICRDRIGQAEGHSKCEPTQPSPCAGGATFVISFILSIFKSRPTSLPTQITWGIRTCGNSRPSNMNGETSGSLVQYVGGSLQPGDRLFE